MNQFFDGYFYTQGGYQVPVQPGCGPCFPQPVIVDPCWVDSNGFQPPVENYTATSPWEETVEQEPSPHERLQQAMQRRPEFTAKGVKIANIDGYSPQDVISDEPLKGYEQDHVDQHILSNTEVMLGPKSGKASDAQVLYLNSINEQELQNNIEYFSKDDPQALEQGIQQKSVFVLNRLSSKLEHLGTLEKSDRPEVINVPLGESVPYITASLAERLNAKNEETNQYDYPELRKAFLGDAATRLQDKFSDRISQKEAALSNLDTELLENPSTPDLCEKLQLRQDLVSSLEEDQARMQKLNVVSMQQATDRVRSVLQKDLANNGPYSQALGRYENITQKLAKDGTVVVVAGGNENEYKVDGVKYDPKDEINILTMGKDGQKNPNVISVAASDTKGTPDDLSDDTVADFSSRGNIDIAAPGKDIVVTNAETGELELRDGSSLAAPSVVGTIARMKEANPNLSFGEVKQILSSTAFKTVSRDKDAVGAGFLDSDYAVELARPDDKVASEPEPEDCC
jgi:hypothetical protein